MSNPVHIQPEGSPILRFQINDSLQTWHLPAKEWLAKNGKDWDILVTGCVVFNPLGKILLLQRASHDTMPNRWEIPGGAVDAEDKSLLNAAARELWEEAGLVASRFTHVVSEGPRQEPGQTFVIGTKTWCRLTFMIEVEDHESVKVDENEHQDFLWVTEEEVRGQQARDRKLPITTEGMSRVVLEAFRLRREAS